MGGGPRAIPHQNGTPKTLSADVISRSFTKSGWLFAYLCVLLDQLFHDSEQSGILDLHFIGCGGLFGDLIEMGVVERFCNVERCPLC